MNENNETTNSPRGKKPLSPYCWQQKAALRIIRAEPTLPSPAFTLLVYFALTWEASDKQSDTFTAHKNYIATKCGISKRKTEGCFLELEKLKLLHIHRQKTPGKKSNEINVYTLQKVAHPVRKGSRTETSSFHAGKEKKSLSDSSKVNNKIETPSSLGGTALGAQPPARGVIAFGG